MKSECVFAYVCFWECQWVNACLCVYACAYIVTDECGQADGMLTLSPHVPYPNACFPLTLHLNLTSFFGFQASLREVWYHGSGDNRAPVRTSVNMDVSRITYTNTRAKFSVLEDFLDNASLWHVKTGSTVCVSAVVLILLKYCFHCVILATRMARKNTKGENRFTLQNPSCKETSGWK